MAVEYLIHNELSRDIIGAAMFVLNELKPGLDEKLYENALVMELRERGHFVEQQKSFPVHFKGQQIGCLIPDMIVNELVVVVPKVVTNFSDSHIAKMTGYLAITDLQLALLLNFKFAKLDVRRVVRSEAHKFASAPSA